MAGRRAISRACIDDEQAGRLGLPKGINYFEAPSKSSSSGRISTLNLGTEFTTQCTMSGPDPIRSSRITAGNLPNYFIRTRGNGVKTEQGRRARPALLCITACDDFRRALILTGLICSTRPTWFALISHEWGRAPLKPRSKSSCLLHSVSPSCSLSLPALSLRDPAASALGAPSLSRLTQNSFSGSGRRQADKPRTRTLFGRLPRTICQRHA
jgi:hypothetical protein